MSSVIPWLLLGVAGLLEVGWSVGIEFTEGFTRPLPTVLTAASMVASLVLLAQAAKSIPMSTAYAVWVGVGVVGSAVAGAVLKGEALSPARVGFIALVLIGILGLKRTAGG